MRRQALQSETSMVVQLSSEAFARAIHSTPIANTIGTLPKNVSYGVAI